MKARFGIPEAVAEAIRVLKEAIVVDPLFWPARYHLGNALRSRGDLTQAAEEYQAALKLNPQDVSIHAVLGKTYRDLGSVDEARATFTLGLEVALAALELRFYLAELDTKAATHPPHTQ